jgi:type II secretory pathway pseudopilin PulG
MTPLFQTPTATPRPAPQSDRPAFSLTELLIASAISLVVMGAIAQLFSLFSRSFTQSQATVDLSGRLRTAAWQLRQDLNGVTVDLVPWTQPESNSGYFELLEGPDNDSFITDPIAGGRTLATATLTADTDDVLLFTTRSAAGPFTGQFGSGSIEAPCAEVAWFCREAGPDAQRYAGTTVYNLYRRQLLVAGYVGVGAFASGNRAAVSAMTATSVSGTRATPLYDLSLRLDGATVIPNTLGDLTRRENRSFLGGTSSIRAATFPFAVILDAQGRLPIEATFESTDRVWDDVILTNVIAFDVRVFDPQAKHQTTSTPSLIPGDPSYAAASALGASGAYVDLGWGAANPLTRFPVQIAAAFPPSGTTAFQSDGVLVSNTGGGVSGQLPVPTYDTWSLHYEYNGENEDGDSLTDEGTNNADDNGDRLPDNTPESETSPPYPVPLKGIEVRIRCFEPTSKQVRQVTIRHTFIRK